VTPEIEMKAKEFIGLGYQHLLTFERPGGGFDWWGNGEPLVYLTAYGMQEFYDTSKVYDLDTRIIDRSREFLFGKQEADGAWSIPGGTHGERVEQLSGDMKKLGLTAYVLWSLCETGTAPSDERVQRGMTWLREHVGQCKDPYILGASALALLTADPKDALGVRLLDELAAMKVVDDKKAHWTSGTSVVSYGGGTAVDVETTAMVVLAMEKAGRHPNVVTQALDWIVSVKDANGNWQATQSTILALKALIAASPGSASQVQGTAIVRVNGQEAGRFDVTPETSDVMRMVEAKDRVRLGANDIEIEWNGEGSLLYQVVGKYYLPWNGPRVEAQEPLSIEVSYDRTELAKNDKVKCTLKATNRQAGVARMVILSVGVPPGFQVDIDDLGTLVEQKRLAKFEMTSREIILYVDTMKAGETQAFEYSLTARYPVKARSEKSSIYEYYDPDKRGLAGPVEFSVR